MIVSGLWSSGSPDDELLRAEGCMFAPRRFKYYGNLSSRVECKPNNEYEGCVVKGLFCGALNGA